MDSNVLSLVIPIITIVTTVGAAVAVFRKAKPEAVKLTAESDLIRTEAQSKIIDDLQEEVDRYRGKLAEVEAHFREQFEELRRQHQAEKAILREELNELRSLNLLHQKRIQALEVKLKGPNE